MRKIDPTSVKDDFVAALDDISNSLVEVKTAKLSGATNKLVAESSLLSASVLWERFVSDLFVAYINRDSSKFATSLQTRVMNAVTKAKLGTFVSQVVQVSLPKHLTKKAVRAALDPKEWNLSFESGASMQLEAAANLATTPASAFATLTASEVASIDAWHGVRNFLAHRSQSSEDHMNCALWVSSVPVDLRRGKHKVKNAGDFLKAVRPPAKEWRVESYIQAMKAIARKL